MDGHRRTDGAPGGRVVTVGVNIQNILVDENASLFSPCMCVCVCVCSSKPSAELGSQQLADRRRLGKSTRIRKFQLPSWVQILEDVVTGS